MDSVHIMISAIGSAGDINPLILIGSKLKQAGHRVDFLASPYFEEKIKRQNLNLLPLGTAEDYHEAISEPDAWKVEKAFPIVWKYVMKASEINYELIRKNKSENTLLIGTTMAIGARLAQEALNVPMASVHLSPALMLSAYGTPQSTTNPMPDWLPAPIKSLWLRGFEKYMLDPVCMPPLNAYRSKLGLPPVSNVISKWIHSPDLAICAFPEWFAKVQRDWPQNSVNTHFPLFKSAYDAPLLPELEEFLAAGEPPIAFTAGTAMAFARPLMETGLKVAEKLGKRCLLVCDFKSEIPQNLPDWAFHVRYANFQTLFKRLALAVHHGGIGTSAMALYCGCPQIISPFAHDQFDNAVRLQGLGVGRMVSNDAPLETWIAETSTTLTPEVKAKCREIAKRIENEMSGEDAILDLLNRRFIQKMTGPKKSSGYKVE